MTPLLAAALICFSPPVHDGDTLTCGAQTVRLSAINAPEVPPKPLEPGGYEAKARLRQLTSNQTVTCTPRPAREQHDRWGRTVATCSVNGVDVGRTMLEGGFACRWTKFDPTGIYQGTGRQCSPSGK